MKRLLVLGLLSLSLCSTVASAQSLPATMNSMIAIFKKTNANINISGNDLKNGGFGYAYKCSPTDQAWLSPQGGYKMTKVKKVGAKGDLSLTLSFKKGKNEIVLIATKAGQSSYSGKVIKNGVLDCEFTNTFGLLLVR